MTFQNDMHNGTSARRSGQPVRSSGLSAAVVCFLVWLTGGLAQPVVGVEPSISNFCMHAAAQVDSEGVFLHHVLTAPGTTPLPPLRLAPAPSFGQSVTLTRAQILAVLSQSNPELYSTNWAGPDRVRVTRRAKKLAETELLELLTSTLQREHVKDRGVLELRLARPWTTLSVPDEAITLRVLDMPANGVTPIFIIRFELRSGSETLGTWQASLQARVWREVWVARTALKRGTTLADADLVRERRDILNQREPLAECDDVGTTIEIAEHVSAGALVPARALKVRPVVRRGQRTDVSFQDGMLCVTMKVEAMEDGVPGQVIRLRNPDSRREIRGKVINENLILVTL